MCNSQLIGGAALIGTAIATDGFGLLAAAPEAAAAGGAVADAAATTAGSSLAAAEVAQGGAEAVAAGGAGPAAAGGITAAQAFSGLSLGGTLVNTIGSIQKANLATAMGKYNATLASEQEQNLNQQGVYAETQGLVSRDQLAGRQRAAMGASGALQGSGTFSDVLDQTAQYGTLAALNEKNKYLNAAWGVQVQESQNQLMTEVEKNSAETQGVTSLLAGSAQAYGINTNWGKNSFGFGSWGMGD